MRKGYSLVELVVTMGVVSTLAGLLLGAIGKARATAAKAGCLNNLRQVAVAAQHHTTAKGAFPAGADGRFGPMPFSTWLTRLLPYVDQADAWRQAQLDYARQRDFWAPTRHAMATTPVAVYLCPAAGPSTGTTEDNQAAAYTSFLGVAGDSYSRKLTGVLFKGSRVSVTDITDGASNTLLAGERPVSADRHFGWWYAGTGQGLDGMADSVMAVRETNRTFRAPTCPIGPYHFAPGADDDPCAFLHFWSNHPGGAHFAFCDGSARFLSYAADPVLPALATRAGGEPAAAAD